ncbi:MAG TPA: hypothetical protein PLK06_01205, partial [bacterium]|nr:hypothetical protein [bacterium]
MRTPINATQQPSEAFKAASTSSEKLEPLNRGERKQRTDTSADVSSMWLPGPVQNLISFRPQSDFLRGQMSTRVTWQNETNETRKRGVSQTKINPDFMRTTHEQVESFKKLWKKERGEDLTDAQALEYSNNLLGFFRALIAVDERIRRWNKRLIDEPKGFAVPGRETYNCIICYQRLEGSEGWYDQYGIKCPPCQKAVEVGIVPGSICTER